MITSTGTTISNIQSVRLFRDSSWRVIIGRLYLMRIMDSAYTFLVIDDSYIDRLVSAMMIRHTFQDCEVHELSGGQPALEWISSAALKPEKHLIILLDIMMPQMNGFEFLVRFDKLKTELKNGFTVIMLSSTLDDADIRQARNHPYVKKFLSKPLSPNHLKESLSQN